MGEPRKATTTGVEVQVLRDNGDVKFSTETYAVTVSENKRVGERVTGVNASPGGVGLLLVSATAKPLLCSNVSVVCCVHFRCHT